MLKRKLSLCFIAFALAIAGHAQSISRHPQSKLALKSSDTHLVAAFNWAKKQAMAYVFNGDPVGPWYEAALPGRNAFCMRDVSHQCMGAQALGLARYNHNMLWHFAKDVSDSRDWCSFWEINRYNKPPAVDYESDAKFWYDLPANFDVLDACYRMYLWTGDLSYINDPVFLNFYKRTLTDYVKRWDLGPGHVMKRKRWLNVRGEFNPHDNFQTARGIPGYDESHKDYVVGITLLASEYAALRDYAYIEEYHEYRGGAGRAQDYLKQADEVKALINSKWWDAKGHHFYSILNKNYQLQGSGGSSLLYYGVENGGAKAQSLLNGLLETIRQHPSPPGVEGESHYAEILYRYGVPKVAYSEIMDLSRKGRYRQEYPEVSYSVIGAIVTGLMGITLDVPGPLGASAYGGKYTQVVVKTLPSLTSQTAWAELRNLPIRTNVVSVRHEGDRKTTLTNQYGPSLIWQATFPGSHATLFVNGKAMKAQAGTEPLGRVTSWVRIPVGGGDKVTVEIPPVSN